MALAVTGAFSGISKPMNTTAVNIRSDLYAYAAEYAQEHDTSIDRLVESYILTHLLNNRTKPSGKYAKLAPVVERLGNYRVREFTQEELDSDPRLAHIMRRD